MELYHIQLILYGTPALSIVQSFGSNLFVHIVGEIRKYNIFTVGNTKIRAITCSIAMNFLNSRDLISIWEYM